MDTNVKKYKYSFITKLICIIMSAVTITVSSGLITMLVLTGFYTEFKEPTISWTDDSTFQSYFISVVEASFREAYANDMHSYMNKELKKQKKYIVDEAIKQYEKMLKDSDSYYIDEEDTIVVDVPSSQKCISYHSFVLTFYEIVDDEMVDDYKAYISKQYDIFVEEVLSEEICYDDYFLKKGNPKSLLYFSQYNDGRTMSFGDNTPANAKEAFDSLSKLDVYFSFVDGKLTYKGISDDFASYLYRASIKDNTFAENTDIIVALDISKTINVLSPTYWSDTFYSLYYFHNNALPIFYEHFIAIAILSVALIIISFISGFYFFSITGKKEEGKAKIYFIDKIPFELHLSVSVGLGLGAFVLFTSFCEFLNFNEMSQITALFIAVFSLFIWILLFEFCSSFARYAHSEKIFYKNSLICMLGTLCYKLGKFITKEYKRFTEILSYKPRRFTKNVILLTIAYILANLLAAMIIILIYIAELYILLFVLVPADIAVNIFIFIKLLEYISKLDNIIDSACKHEEPLLDTAKLPASLKALAESMNYTNTELQNAVAKAVKDERLRTELITNVSHDLKTPLTSIITYADLLSKCDIQDEKAKEYISVLDDKSAKLKRLIDDLIEASKVTSGNVTVNLTKINLSELCLQSTVDAQSDFEKAGLNLVVKSSDNSSVVMADGAKAFRVIENLLSNARKYSAPASRVYVQVYNEGSYGVFEIKNISAQQLDISPEELTERFVRGDKSRHQEGNGLGLSIAQELCKLQNGKLELIIDGDLFKAKVKLPLA